MDTRTEEFVAHVQDGGLVEVHDWMPDEYRSRLIKFIEMHGNSELMGVLPERDWILRAPTLQRKLALTAKIQDEVGHAQLIYRVVEDLGKPRVACLDDLIAGKSKFHNVFHYPTQTWGDVGVIAWLVDAAAIVSQKALLKCSYAPYARIMKKICWEESFHILHGRDVILALVTGTPEQFELVQEALLRWWEPLMHFHGTPLAAEDDPMVFWRIKSQANEAARQEFLDGYVPQIRELGLEVPDPKLRKRRRRRLGVHRARLGEAQGRRLGARACVGGAARLPADDAGGGRLGRARDPRGGGMTHVYEVFRRERQGQPFQHAGSVDRARSALRRDLRPRAVRAAPGVGRSLARAPRRRAGGRRVPGRVRPQVPPRGRLLDQDPTPRGTGACRSRARCDALTRRIVAA